MQIEIWTAVSQRSYEEIPSISGYFQHVSLSHYNWTDERKRSNPLPAFNPFETGTVSEVTASRRRRLEFVWSGSSSLTRFGETYCSHPRRRRVPQATSRALWRRFVPQKRLPTSNGLHGAIPEDSFILITSIPTNLLHALFIASMIKKR
jgi:hypothetical protein